MIDRIYTAQEGSLPTAAEEDLPDHALEEALMRPSPPTAPAHQALFLGLALPAEQTGRQQGRGRSNPQDSLFVS